ncbi:thioredoxin family protein [Alicyclobacillus vulcanalis]|uniref:Thioredoxin n=1 Tax=Alicyclobacillus vulcanalis TaxID=252246 RepID=A0A1N7P405_9BACL|nr:thioredoxin family protein [Alicyclobacillus vulcanalis]SIT05321.1 Thioredoxin [Alicyclobacillus vulcanalis]
MVRANVQGLRQVDTGKETDPVMFRPYPGTSPEDIRTLPERALVFIHTPLCGTCQLARKMLEVVDAAHQGALPLYELDANLAPAAMQTWKVESVPALLYVKKGEIAHVQYRFSDVVHLASSIQPFLTA